MPKFKRGDKVKLKPDAEQICRNLDCIWHSCWRDAMGAAGKITGRDSGAGSLSKWNTLFPTSNGSFWIYEKMIMFADQEEEALTDTEEIHKLLDRLIKGA